MTDKAQQRPQAAWRGYLGFSVAAAVFLFPFMRVLTLGSDEGTLLTGAARIVHGEVFARDFFEVMGPGTFYLLAGFFRLFGVTFLSARVWLFVSMLGTALVLYSLARQVCPKDRLLPATILAATYFGMFAQGVSYHADSNLFVLLALASMFAWLRKRNIRWLAASGFSVGLATCILQPKGALLFAALLAFVCLVSRGSKASWRNFVAFSAPYATVGLVVLLYFWSQGALPSLVYVNYTFPTHQYSSVNAVGYGFGLSDFRSTWEALGSGALWSRGMAWVFSIPYLFLAALPAIVVLQGALRFAAGHRKATPELLLLWLTGSALWLSEFHRKDIYHLVYGSPILMLLCLHMAREDRRRFDAVALRAVAISAMALAAFNFLMVAAVPHAVATRAGTVRLFESGDALRYLISRTAPGQAIFVYPYAPMYYFLCGASNPTRYSLLTYNYNTGAQFEEAIAAIERANVEYVLWDTQFVEKTAKSTFPGSQPAAGAWLMENYLLSHFTAKARFGSVTVLHRNPEQR